MKKMTLTAAAIVLGLSMTGCSLFSGSTDKKAETEAAQAEDTGVTLCDTFTHKDPEDLSYETRYGLTSGENNPEVVDAYKQSYGVDIVAEYWFLYADKDDKALAEYDYYVFKTEEDAAKFKKGIDEMGFAAVEVDGCVCYSISDEKGVSDLILMQQQYSGLGSDKASDYAQFIKESYAYLSL